MRFPEVGAGATGGRQLEAGRDVTSLIRPVRAPDLRDAFDVVIPTK